MPASPCPKCGGPNPATARFCKLCGAPLPAAAAGAAALPVKPASVNDTTEATRPVVTGLQETVAIPSAEVASAVGLAARAPNAVIRIGRGADNDVVLDYPFISGHHARITVAGGVATLEDLGSTNGTALGAPDHWITKSPLAESDTVYFGTLRVPAARLLAGGLALGEAPHTLLAFSGDEMVLGRDPACHQVIDHPAISRRHARLARTAAGITVEDLHSANGTFVNGRRITARVTVSPGDVISLGSVSFSLSADGTILKRDLQGNVTIEARGLAVEVPGKRLLDKVSLTFFPAELVGVMGPSGSGKTTLVNALNGYTPPTTGVVLFNGQDLYDNYDLYRLHIGYVPQDDIMHRDLTVGEALYYTARLRLPADFSDADILVRTTKVLAQLGLEDTSNVIIGTPERKGISGGERKRVNIAMELLTDPAVLFLDEPTSGLSSEDALMVMKVLRPLADAGKTVIMTIHQPSPEVFRMMDRLVVVDKDRASAQPGEVVYFGPASPDAVSFFNPAGVPGVAAGEEPSPDAVLRGLARASMREWSARFAASEYKRRYVDERAGVAPPPAARAGRPKVARKLDLMQWWTLVRRCLAVKLKDRENLVVLLGQAPLVAALVVLIFGPQARVVMTAANWPVTASAICTTLFMLVIPAIWFGCSNSAREIVAEWAIYRRERMVNLKIPSYVASKLTVLGGLCLFQCSVLFGAVWVGCRLKGPLLGMVALLTLSCLVGLGWGLIVSAFSRTSEVAISMVPVVLLPMILLGGAMAHLDAMSTFVHHLAHLSPSRWAFEGLLLPESAAHPRWQPPAPAFPVPAGVPMGTQAPSLAPPLPKPQDVADLYFPEGERTSVRRAIVVLSGQLLLLVVGILIILKSRDIHGRLALRGRPHPAGPAPAPTQGVRPAAIGGRAE